MRHAFKSVIGSENCTYQYFMFSTKRQDFLPERKEAVRIIYLRLDVPSFGIIIVDTHPWCTAREACVIS